MASLSTRQLAVLKKTFAALTTVATVLSLAGFAALPSVANAVAPADYGLTEGDVISASGSSDPDIYIVNEHGYKRLFLNPIIFNFYGHIGWNKVKPVAPATRDAFGTSGIFRNCETNDPKVYGVEVTAEDSGVLHWVNVTGEQAVQQDPNFFKKVFCINNNEFNWYPKGSDYTSLSQIPVYTRPGAPTSGPLSASLASDNPAAGTIVQKQALAPLAHFQVNGSGAVTSVELKRLGISADSVLEDVFLFVNGVRVSDSGNVSSGMITFNNAAGLFQAGNVVAVKADIADAAAAGSTVGIQLTKLNTSTVSVSGNLMNVAAAPTLATVDISTATGPGDFNPQNDVNVWQATFNVGNEDVYFKRFSIREIGSIDSAHVRNLRLFVDGVQVATDMDLDADGYASFLMNHRMLIGNRTIKVLADVVGGSGRTMSFSLRGSYDVELMDEAYNVGVEATASGASTNFPVTAASGIVGSATVTVSKATNSPSGDVIDDATNVALARFDIKAFGEAVKIETLAVRASVSSVDTVDGLQNGRLLINGVQYGSTAALLTTGATTSFTTNFTLAAGATATVEIQADMKDTTGSEVGTGDVVSILLDNQVGNAQGVSSANSINVPGTTIEGNNLTVVTGTSSLAKYTAYANQTVVIPRQGVKLGHYVLTGSSAEDISVNSIEVGFNGGDQWTASQLSNVYLNVENFGNTAPKTTVSSTSSSSYNVTFTLAKNTTRKIEVWGDVGTFTVFGTNDTMATDMKVYGSTVSSGATANTAVVAGQTLTAGTGSIASSLDSSSPVEALVADAMSIDAATFKWTSTNDSGTITEVVLKVGAAVDAGAIANVKLMDGGTQLRIGSLSGTSVTFSGLSVPVPANGNKSLTVALDLGTVGVNNASSSANAKITLDSYKAADGSGTQYTGGDLATDRAGNSLYVHASYPTLSTSYSGLSTTLTTGTNQILSRFVIAPNGGEMTWKKTIFTVEKTGGAAGDPSLASSSFKLYDVTSGGRTEVVGTFTAGSGATGVGELGTSGTVTFVATNEQDLSTLKTYQLESTINGSLASGDFVRTKIAAPSSVAAPTTYTVVAATSASFVWSDKSGDDTVLHTDGGTTADWMNDYKVKNLPLDGFQMTK